ncbi:hypothetical protein BXY41_12011 [Lacrimispora xylanisolvens]|uniref:DUF6128 domain-containing protein n=1 Tax=Lacrimispora xylanisolvens TaxID=384636 RepID=A0A2S6HDD5_9FIRM|nr:DUF6128 domain-containing protein [Hungatella xylanolytica]PPK75478.1 hypothetical protein BXY41_12011 [Hungatella xylanolytica]
MSNYRRLISYIYAYEGGVKGKNIGFAKIETRGIQCKITVSVKRIYVGGNDIGVYLLAGEQEIYLGNIFIRGGSGEFRATVSVNDIERSGFNMDQCFGLTIHDVKNTWRSYTTIWEDAVAHAAAVDLENTDSVVKENSAISEEQIKKAVQEIEKEFPLEDGDSQDTKNEEEVLLQAESPASSDSEPSPEAESLMPEIQQMTGSIPQDGNTRTSMTGPTAGGRQGNPPSVTAPAPDRQQNTRPTMTGPIPGWWQEPRPTGPMPTTPMPNVTMPTGPMPTGPMPAGTMPTGTMPTGSMSPVPNTTGPASPRPRPTGPMPTTPMTAESVHTDPTEEAQTVLQSQQESVPLMPKPMMSEAEDGGLKESVQMSSGDAGLAEDADVFPEPEAGTTRLYRADAVIKETKNQDHTETKLGDPEVLEHLRQNESQEENQHSVIWEKLRKEHTRILAFDYEDGCEILTIKPQDIGLLPRDAWVYGNNSFLLHGYYNYRYLILARLNTEGTPRYLLGIPGHYYSNERYMASMFGFPNFVLSKDQPMEDGRFGFWYTDIKVGG